MAVGGRLTPNRQVKFCPYPQTCVLIMALWINIRRSLDQAVLHKERCIQVPSRPGSSDFWEGGWFEYPDKDTALDALEQAGATQQIRCPLCKP